MGKTFWVLAILIIVALLASLGFLYFFSRQKILLDPTLLQTKTSNMKITSQAFENNQIIPGKYTCQGQNINPRLSISDTPSGAKSLVLIVEDPDAPAGTWHHWVVYNIAPETTLIQENSLPEGAAQIKNDFGNENYGGPCPPSGTHRYFFNIYALDQTLDLPANSKLNDLEEKMSGHILDKGQLIGLYQKTK